VEEIIFTRINESDYMVILKELEKQEVTSSLFNELEDPPFNNKIIKISILPIDFDKNKYKSFFIFIYHCSNVLSLTKMDELNINKKFIELK
jgi:hypothetical protein